jgi:adenosylcobyric acid synthase
MKKSIMIQGTMSNVGKSLITAGLCRVFYRDGYSVAPFKSQNMSLNSFITEDGLEMGRAQAVQAEAAGAVPSALMNPILLKPVSDMGSQVIVNGISRGHMKAADYFEYKKTLAADIMQAYATLSKQYDIIVIEGAGSPAEINLKQNDIVNMGLAKMVDAPVLLVGDIDPGGVFAQLVGTLALLDDEERDRVKGLIINKFRGDIRLLNPGLTMLADITGKSVIGTIPYLNIDIEDEDSLAEKTRAKTARLNIDNESEINFADNKAYKIAQYDILADAIYNNLDISTIYNIMD